MNEKDKEELKTIINNALDQHQGCPHGISKETAVELIDFAQTWRHSKRAAVTAFITIIIGAICTAIWAGLRTLGIPIVILAVLLFVLSGCGHNVVTYSDGIGIDFGLKPDTLGIAFNVRYGKIFNAVVKEKTEVDMEAGFSSMAGDTSTAGTTTTLDSKIHIKTGDQITGYTVDLEKAKQGR